MSTIDTTINISKDYRVEYQAVSPFDLAFSKRRDKKRIKEIADSIERIGYIDDYFITVLKRGRELIIRDGNQRVRAAISAGLEEIPAQVISIRT